jgi:hypothetical protein
MSNSIVQTYHFYYQSNQANYNGLNDSPPTAYCRFVLNKILTLPSRKYGFVITVNRVNIPYCFQQYNTEYGTNIVSFQLYDASTDVGFYASSVVIPDGNYTVQEMMTVLAPLISANIHAGTTLNNTIDWIYDATTNRLGIKITGQKYLGNEWYIYFLPGVIPINLGIAELDTFISNNTFYSYGTKSVNMNYMQNIYMVSDAYSDMNAYAAAKQQSTDSNIIAVIPINKPPNELLEFEFRHPIRIPLDLDVINQFDFQLTDYNGRPLVSFDLPWSFHFSIDLVKVSQEDKLPPPMYPIPTLESTSFFMPTEPIPESTPELDNQNLLDLSEQIKESLLALKSNVQKRKSPPNQTTTVSESRVKPTDSNTINTTPSSSGTAEITEQETPESNSAKRIREA